MTVGKVILNKIEYIEVAVTPLIDRDTEEGELAWEDLTNHHDIPFVKEGRYLMEQFWCGYSPDPYENLERAKDDYGDDWTNEGMFPKVIADAILKQDPLFSDWEKVLIYVTW